MPNFSIITGDVLLIGLQKGIIWLLHLLSRGNLNVLLKAFDILLIGVQYHMAHHNC